MKNNLFRVISPALILAALLVSACNNIFEEPTQRGAPAAGRGIALISIGGETAGGRTLLPDYLALYYVLEFARDEETVPGVFSNGTAEVELDAGTWDLTVKGYLSRESAEIHPESPVITGEAKGVEIKNGETATVTVTLAAPVAEGEGWVSFDLTFPNTVTHAALEAKALLATAAAPKQVNLLSAVYKTNTGSKGRIAFGAGFYRLKYTLQTGDGLVLAWSGAVHIYKGMESPLAAKHLQGDFIQAFVPVTGITGLPTSGTAGTGLDLTTASVNPVTATNTIIVWTASGAGLAEGMVSGTVTPTEAGTLQLKAAVQGGKGQGQDYTTEFTLTIASAEIVFTTIQAVTDYLSSSTGGATAADPVSLIAAINYDDNGEDLLNAIETAGKHVALDLSRCALSGTVFNPNLNSENNNGKAKIVSLVLPDTAQTITQGKSWDGASFNEFSQIKSIEGSGITTIDAKVFSGVETLTTVNLPIADTFGVNSAYAFRGCAALTTVNFPELASMGTFAFQDCTALTSVDLPKLATLVGNTFTGCTELSRVNISGATGITNMAFANAFKENAAVTISMGSTAPSLGNQLIFQNVASTVTLTVQVPSGATGYDSAWKTNLVNKGGFPESNVTIVPQ